MVSRLRASLLFLVLAVLLCAGCKQGLNEICQVNDDCEEGLECEMLTGRCVEENQPTPDAAAADARVDASPVDATVDATVDAMVDASPVDADVDAN